MANSIAVIGAGTLGWQIALTFAVRGVPVRLHDVAPAALERGLGFLRAELALQETAGELPDGAAVAFQNVTACDTLAAALDDAWLAIEAIPERLELKRSFFAELSALAGPDVILASNSSSYKSSAFADVT